jgi:putative glycosyltransferase (TIGR04372 family)
MKQLFCNKILKLFYSKFYLISEAIIGALLVSIIFLLRPIINIRIGRINNKVIGHISMETDYSMFRILNEGHKRQVNIWYFASETSCNKFLQNQVRNHLYMFPRILLSGAFKIIQASNFWKDNLIPYYDFSRAIAYPEVTKILPDLWSRLYNTPGFNDFFSASPKDIHNLKNRIGVTKDFFACVNVRDNEFKKTELNTRNSGNIAKDLISNSLKFDEFRNSNVESFLSSSVVMAENNIDFIRIGKKAVKLSNPLNYEIIDYANSNLRNDRDDILLLTSAKFIIGTGNGIDDFARWARTPVFLMDLGHFNIFSSIFYSPADFTPVVLPKIVREKSNGKILSIKEINELKVMSLNPEQFRAYINSKKCPIILEQNDSTTISKTVSLGINYLDRELLDNKYANNLFELGQNLFFELYRVNRGFNVPALSPWWPNAAQV